MPMKFIIRPGNNAKLVRKVFLESGRCEQSNEGPWFPGWEEADDQFDSLYNFKWKACSIGINFDLIGKHGLKQVVNHIRGHGELTTKDCLFFNMRDYFHQRKRKDLHNVLPLTFVVDYLKDTVAERMNKFVSIHRIID